MEIQSGVNLVSGSENSDEMHGQTPGQTLILNINPTNIIQIRRRLSIVVGQNHGSVGKDVPCAVLNLLSESSHLNGQHSTVETEVLT